MKLLISLTFAILACLATRTTAQTCKADIVFIIDASDTTRGSLYSGFQNALRLFAATPQVADTGIRAGVVYMNASSDATRTVPLTGNRGLLTQLINNNNVQLGGGLLIANGLTGARTVLSNTPRDVPQIAVVVTAGRSRGGVIPTSEANSLKMIAQVVAFGIQSPNILYSRVELETISTSSSDVQELPNADTLFNSFDVIAKSRCMRDVVTTVRPIVVPTASPNAICNGCELENGVGYKPVPGNCRQFIMCQLPPHENAIIDCEDGLFYKSSLQKCVYYPESDCNDNRCTPGTYLFSSKTCGVYWNCTDGLSQTECCPRNTLFDESRGECLPTNTPCNRYCGDPESRAVCTVHKPVPDNPCKFYAFDGNGEAIEQFCAGGTNFDPTTCLCSIITNEPCPHVVITNNCEPKFVLNLNTANRVIDEKGSWIGNNHNVVIDGTGSATFNGENQQRFSMSRYTNVDFGLALAIVVRFNDADSTSNMAVVSTGGCLDRPGLYILGGNGLVTLGIVGASNGAVFETSASTTGTNTWKEVAFYYDGKTLSGEIRTPNAQGVFNVITPIPSVAVSSSVERILTVRGAYQVGYAHFDQYPGFVGQVRGMNIWIACDEQTGPSFYRL